MSFGVDAGSATPRTIAAPVAAFGAIGVTLLAPAAIVVLARSAASPFVLALLSTALPAVLARLDRRGL
eukprot:2641618-Pyramimonas_sp.AAC.1